MGCDPAVIYDESRLLNCCSNTHLQAGASQGCLTVDGGISHKAIDFSALLSSACPLSDIKYSVFKGGPPSRMPLMSLGTVLL